MRSMCSIETRRTAGVLLALVGYLLSSAAIAEVQLQEVVVTAQKREQNILEVPVPVSVLEAQSLVDSNQTSFADYFSSIPNVTIAPGLQSQTLLAIRGIAPGGIGNTTVAVLVDDAPYSSVDLTGGGNILPDFDPADLSRVEVLRGPQGALYGASGMGGLIKFVTVDPSTSALTGRLQATGQSVYNGNGLGYGLRGAINIPIADTLAIRASAVHRVDPGYIDDVFTHADGVNRTTVDGGHFAALWRPYSDWSVKLSALIQRSRGDGSSEIDVPTAGFPETDGLKGLQQVNVAGTGAYYRNFQAYSAIINGDIGKAHLTSVTDYNTLNMHDSFDLTFALGPVNIFFFPSCAAFAPQTCGSPVFNEIKDHKLSQELRLTVPFGTRFDWLMGAFFTEERQSFNQVVAATNPYTGASEGVLLGSPPLLQPGYEELAAFTDLTVHFTPRFQVQLGGREVRILEPERLNPAGFGPLGTPSASTFPDYHSDYFTYLVTPEFKLTPDVMLYVRAASGYRPGGANCPGSGCTGLATGNPVSYTQDSTQNYDLGVKADLLNHTWIVDSSAYYIKWKNMQLANVNATNSSYVTNAGNAKSEGVELSSQWLPVTGLKFGGWIVLSNAVLTQDMPPTSSVYGASGDRLPNAARFSGNLAVDYDFALGVAGYRGFFGAAESYMGDRYSAFLPVQPPGTPQLPRQVFPSYAKTDLRVGITKDDWKVDLSALNVTDRRGQLSGGAGSAPPYAFYYIQPRTISLSVAKSF